MGRAVRGRLISVIIPVFNNETYLSEAIESVLAQSHRSVDLIVVDDGSTDASGAIARKYDGKLRCIRQANSGIGAARNSGLKLAEGDYFAFLDSDDRMLPGCLARLLEALEERPEVDIVFGHVREFLTPELRLSEVESMRPPISEIPGSSPTSMLARRQGFFRVGEFSTDREKPEAFDWFSTLLREGVSHLTIRDILWERRLHRRNTSKNLDYQKTLPAMLKEILDRNRHLPTS